MDGLNKQKIVKIFNKQLSEFVDRALTTFEHLRKNKEIMKLVSTLETTITISPTVPITIFYEKVYKKYKKQIDKSDENFFLSLPEIEYASMETFSFLRTIYVNTNESNKKIIWDYVHRLKALSVKYFKENEKLQ